MLRLVEETGKRLSNVIHHSCICDTRTPDTQQHGFRVIHCRSD